MARWLSAVGAATALAAVVAAVSVTPDLPEDDSMIVASWRGGPSSTGQEPFGITVRGSGPGNLYPGITRDMRLSLRNPYDFALNIRSLRAEVVESSKRRCKPSAANLVPGRYAGTLPVTVPARGRAAVGAIPLSMPPAASPACQGVVFTLRLTGTATKVAGAGR